MSIGIAFRENEYINVLMSPHEVEILNGIIHDIKPDVAVEIGSWEGGSSIVISKNAGRVFCVDPWVDFHDEGMSGDSDEIRPTTSYNFTNSPEERFSLFCRNAGDSLFKTIFPCRGTSAQWSKVWRMPIDFLFIDGCHTYEMVKEDIEGWVPHVRQGGLIVGHDYRKIPGTPAEAWEFPGVAKAVGEYFENFYVIPGTSFWCTFKV